MPFETPRQNKEPKNEEKHFPPVYNSYYDVLGIPPYATEFEIKTAHKRKVFKFHTDRPENQGKSHELMVEINNARDILMDPEKRKIYDQRLRSSGIPEPPIMSEAESQRLNQLTRDLIDLEYKYTHPSAEELSGKAQRPAEELFNSIIRILKEIGLIQGMTGKELGQYLSRNLNNIKEKRNQEIKRLRKTEIKKLQDRLAELKRLLLNSQQSLQQTDTVLDRVLNRAYRKQLDEAIKTYREEITMLEDNERYLREITKS